MSVDYKFIADNDPGGELEAAFNTMQSETITETPEIMITYRGVGAGVSLAASAELEAAILASSLIPSWVDKALSTDGIDINDPQTAAVLSSLVSPETASAIIALGVSVTPKYKELKDQNYLAKARLMREEGRI